VSNSILLVDDSAVARRLIRTLISEKLGDAVTYAEAAGGVEALDMARSRSEGPHATYRHN